ncbi:MULTISPECIES: DUF1517 domain-containing protein [unclassified Synechococcus]|uniref:DUF1517 domain-containing protein n=1 Tax=unclassified Synechococcus TaxID=2626047 RepID=UPI001E63F931|nr:MULTISPECIES: DUF1517 domain-containing protein [unclassified Synechococcus]MEA5423403.1 DUF1517 domain-containing protein [Synechococcus sp. CCY9202]
MFSPRPNQPLRSNRPGQRPLRRLFSWLAIPLLVAGLLLAHPDPSWAARGGRIGGGSFRSAPSVPRSYGGGNLGGGGYRGGSYGRGFGGGIGFPFLIPIFGFGGGGLFGFLILMAVVGVLLNAVRGMGNGPSLGSGNGVAYPSRPDGPVTIAQVQVGLLATARQLQQDLRRLAASVDTGTNAGLQRALQETTLALLRHPDLWVYAHSDVGQVPFASAESTFNRLSMAERSKLSREVTSNVGGQRLSDSSMTAGDSDATSDFIAITLLVATRTKLALKGSDTAEDLRQTFQKLGAVGIEDLLALEVIWQPDGAGDVLSTEELLTAYPDLQHL